MSKSIDMLIRVPPNGSPAGTMWRLDIGHRTGYANGSTIMSVRVMGPRAEAVGIFNDILEDYSKDITSRGHHGTPQDFFIHFSPVSTCMGFLYGKYLVLPYEYSVVYNVDNAMPIDSEDSKNEKISILLKFLNENIIIPEPEPEPEPETVTDCLCHYNGKVPELDACGFPADNTPSATPLLSLIFIVIGYIAWIVIRITPQH